MCYLGTLKNLWLIIPFASFVYSNMPVFPPGERGSLKRNRTLTQLAEIQRNTCVFEYLDHAGRRNLMKLPVPQIVPQPFLGYGFFEVLAPLGFRESFARLRRIA